jgi:hypothetical protein
MGYTITKCGIKLRVKLEHLHNGSSVRLTKLCDYNFDGCLTKVLDQPYHVILRQRHRNNEGMDSCRKCARHRGAKSQSVSPYEKSLKFLFPELATQLITEGADTSKIYAYSGFKHLWECPNKACNYKWETSVNARTSLSTNCPACCGQKTTDGNSFSSKARKIVLSEWHVTKNNDLTPDDVTNSSGRLIWWKCATCSHEWETSVANRTNGTNCPNCRESKGERFVRDFLKSENIPFESQVEFEGLRGVGGRSLKFDFIIKDQCRIFAVEYDGEQHFIEKDFFGGAESLSRTQEHDHRKDVWCKENDVPILRIKYDIPFDLIPERLLSFIGMRLADIAN